MNKYLFLVLTMVTFFTGQFSLATENAKELANLKTEKSKTELQQKVEALKNDKGFSELQKQVNENINSRIVGQFSEAAKTLPTSDMFVLLEDDQMLVKLSDEQVRYFLARLKATMEYLMDFTKVSSKADSKGFEPFMSYLFRLINFAIRKPTDGTACSPFIVEQTRKMAIGFLKQPFGLACFYDTSVASSETSKLLSNLLTFTQFTGFQVLNIDIKHGNFLKGPLGATSSKPFPLLYFVTMGKEKDSNAYKLLDGELGSVQDIEEAILYKFVGYKR